MKPDPRIFRHLLETHELAPERTIFIDDSETNVQAAATLGMIGIHFTGADELRRELRSLGLPLSEAVKRRRAASER